MSFFGLTLLGSGSCFERVAVQALKLHEVEDAKFEGAFRLYSGESETLLNATLPQSENKDNYMLRNKILSCIKHALSERDLSQTEIAAILTHFDTDSCGLITQDEFMRSVKKMKEITQTTGKATQYTSNLKFRDDRHRHRRADQDPQQYFMQPLTNSQVSPSLISNGVEKKVFRLTQVLCILSLSLFVLQEIGWHTRAAVPPNATMAKKYFPLRSTEITECEGRGMNDYYGLG